MSRFFHTTARTVGFAFSHILRILAVCVAVVYLAACVYVTHYVVRYPNALEVFASDHGLSEWVTRVDHVNPMPWHYQTWGDWFWAFFSIEHFLQCGFLMGVGVLWVGFLGGFVFMLRLWIDRDLYSDSSAVIAGARNALVVLASCVVASVVAVLCPVLCPLFFILFTALFNLVLYFVGKAAIEIFGLDKPVVDFNKWVQINRWIPVVSFAVTILWAVMLSAYFWFVFLAAIAVRGVAYLGTRGVAIFESFGLSTDSAYLVATGFLWLPLFVLILAGLYYLPGKYDRSSAMY